MVVSKKWPCPELFREFIELNPAKKHLGDVYYLRRGAHCANDIIFLVPIQAGTRRAHPPDCNTFHPAFLTFHIASGDVLQVYFMAIGAHVRGRYVSGTDPILVEEHDVPTFFLFLPD